MSLFPSHARLAAVMLLSASFQVHGFDLLDAYQLALTRDPAYASARAAWAAAQEKLPQGRALLLPAVTASANTNFNDREIAFRNGVTAPDRFNSNGYNVGLTQPIYRLQNHAQYTQAKLLASQADAQLAAAGHDLMIRVAQAYFDVLLAQDNVDLAAAQRQSIGEQLAQAKLNFELGNSPSTDVHEAQARSDLLTAQEVMARNDLVVKRRALNAILAMQPEALAPLGPSFRLEEPQPNDVQKWASDAIEASPHVAVQRRAFDIATEEIARNRYAHYPTVDAVASYGRSSAGSGILGGVGYDTTTATIGVQLTVPIYQGGAINSRTREAAANAEKARGDLETISRQVVLGVEQAFSGVRSGISQIAALRAALVSTEKQVQATDIGRREGARNSIDFLNAEQQLFAARRELALAQYGYLMNRLRLAAAAGSLDETELIKVNSMLNGTRKPVGVTGTAQETRAPLGIAPAAAPALVTVLPASPASATEPAGPAVSAREPAALRLSLDLGSPPPADGAAPPPEARSERR